MKVNTMMNLYLGSNAENNFKVLICAESIEEAMEIAESYTTDTNLDFSLEVSEWVDINDEFDCDYVLTKSQSY